MGEDDARTSNAHIEQRKRAIYTRRWKRIATCDVR